MFHKLWQCDCPEYKYQSNLTENTELNCVVLQSQQKW